LNDCLNYYNFLSPSNIRPTDIVLFPGSNYSVNHHNHHGLPDLALSEFRVMCTVQPGRVTQGHTFWNHWKPTRDCVTILLDPYDTHDDDDDDEWWVDRLCSSALTAKKTVACWWYDLMKSSVFRSRRNEDGRWQLR